MRQAEIYTTRLLGDYPRPKYGEYMAKLNKVFKQLDRLRVKNYLEFMHRVETKEKFEEFYKGAGLSVQEIVRAIKYLFFWVFPQRNT